MTKLYSPTRRCVKGFCVLVCIIHICFCDFSAAQADVVYTHQPVPLNTGSYWYSDDLGGRFSHVSWRVFDNFNLNSNAEITGFSWRGAYFDEINPDNNPVFPNTIGWDVGLFSDTTGDAGSAYLSENFLVSEVASTFVDFTEFNGRMLRMYDFEVQLSTPFAAQSGEDYLFSVRANTADNGQDSYFLWTQGFGSDDSSFQTNLVSGESFLRPGDRTFSILGTVAVPEPSCSILAGLLSAFTLHRRRRMN